MTDKLVKITGTGVEVLDDKLYEKIKNGNLSPSMATSLLTCPADWLLEKYITPLLEHEDQIYLERGTAFHKIMEKFYLASPEERSPQLIGKLTSEVVHEDHPHFLNDRATIDWLKSCVLNYLKMNYDYKHEIVPNLTIDGKTSPSLELFIDGKVGNVNRRIVGFVDKIVERDGLLCMDDWKTGKTVNSYTPDKPVSSSNHFDYWRQQSLYAMLLEKKGIKLDNASLIFPMAETVVNVDFKRDDVQQHVIEDMEKTDETLTRLLDKNFFPFKPGIFCQWCHLFYEGRCKGRPRYPKINQSELAQIAELPE